MNCVCALFSKPGVGGLVAALVLLLVLYLIAWIRVPKRDGGYPLEPKNDKGIAVKGSFEPILGRYNRLAEIVIGLGTGSIALLAGSSALHSDGKLPCSYSSPLVLLAFSVTYLVLFAVLLNYWYEMWQHGNPYTHHKYRAVIALGFSGLLCFAFGYIWLGFALARR